MVPESALKDEGYARAAELNCFDTYATRQCQDSMTWVRNPMAISFYSWAYRKKGLVVSGNPNSRAWVRDSLICLSVFSLSASKSWGSLPPTLMVSYRGWPKVIQIQNYSAAPQKTLLWSVVRWDWEGIDSLFLFSVQLVFSMKPMFFMCYYEA